MEESVPPRMEAERHPMLRREQVVQFQIRWLLEESVHRECTAMVVHKNQNLWFTIGVISPKGEQEARATTPEKGSTTPAQVGRALRREALRRAASMRNHRLVLPQRNLMNSAHIPLRKAELLPSKSCEGSRCSAGRWWL